MHMNMEDRLAAVRICVDNHAVTVVGEPTLACDLSRSQQQVTEHRRIFFRSLIQRVDMLTRHDQNMRRSLRRDIVEGKANVILVNFGRGYLARNYLAKQAISRSHNEYNN